ncbi:SRR1-like protein [Liparis tanakae]|uniref:SRR1-like protein n=1 Tax=Liparis tanakae TaxID=230148 RepID=A0A4Z2GP98_9TELE|nr:SRR1-like protein [Liparis tanakae]
MPDPAEEWQVARRRKGAARKPKSPQVSSTGSREPLDVERTVKRIRDTVSELRCDDIWQQWKKAASSASWSPPETERLQSVCFGLGSFSSCASARFQLAMLLLLLDAGQIPLKDCSVYDPAFSCGEMDVLRELGLTVLTENEEGKSLATQPTLFYLMHCGKALYNNLLWRNWSVQHLPLMKIIGNSFNGMMDRTVEREFRRDYSYVAQAVSVCEERRLPCPSRLVDVFSDTAVITFPAAGLQRLPQCTWAEPPEPQYQHCSDLEIIQRETHG